MTKAKIIEWLGYWNRASMGPNLNRVETFEDMVTCRKFNMVMNVGLFYDVTDEQLWEAFQEWRLNR